MENTALICEYENVRFIISVLFEASVWLFIVLADRQRVKGEVDNYT